MRTPFFLLISITLIGCLCTLHCGTKPFNEDTYQSYLSAVEKNIGQTDFSKQVQDYLEQKDRQMMVWQQEKNTQAINQEVSTLGSTLTGELVDRLLPSIDSIKKEVCRSMGLAEDGVEEFITSKGLAESTQKKWKVILAAHIEKSYPNLVQPYGEKWWALITSLNQ